MIQSILEPASADMELARQCAAEVGRARGYAESYIVSILAGEGDDSSEVESALAGILAERARHTHRGEPTEWR